MNEGTGGRRAPGDRIADRYLLVRLLEMGGMGSVWVAHHVGLDVQVAIKFIRADTSSSVSAQRLLQEARAAASLDHPAIVHVSDVGRTPEGETYLVMELLDGEDLASVLARERRLDPATAVRVLLPVLGALSAMHTRGMVHRDIKPENIFLSCDDSGRWQPKLIDFGLARVPDSGERLTQRGFMVGTPAYMSPERIGGEDADPGDDIWALCVVLYEIVAGELPFDGATDLALCAALQACEPRSLLDHGAGDEALWAIVQRGLSRRRARWGSARDLGKALAAWAWKHGVLDDVTGVSLRPGWLGDDDVRRLAAPPGSKVKTARFEVPFRTRGATPATHPLATAATVEAPAPAAPAATAAPPSVTMGAPAPKPPAPSPSKSEPGATPVEIPPAEASRLPARRMAAFALATLAGAAIAASLLRRAPASSGEPAPPATRPEAPAAPPHATETARPTASERATTPAAPSTAAEGAPSARAPAAPAARAPRGTRDAGRPTDDLKDPFR